MKHTNGKFPKTRDVILFHTFLRGLVMVKVFDQLGNKFMNNIYFFFVTYSNKYYTYGPFVVRSVSDCFLMIIHQNCRKS